jgi:hypothetical protein
MGTCLVRRVAPSSKDLFAAQPLEAGFLYTCVNHHWGTVQHADSVEIFPQDKTSHLKADAGMLRLVRQHHSLTRWGT